MERSNRFADPAPAFRFTRPFVTDKERREHIDTLRRCGIGPLPYPMGAIIVGGVPIVVPDEPLYRQKQEEKARDAKTPG